MNDKANCYLLPSYKEELKRGRTVDFVYDDFIIPKSLTRFPFKKTFYIETLGCQANYRDEEVISALLTKAGFMRLDDYEKAQILIINTCAVRENAEQKVKGHLGIFKALKNKNKNLIICLCGCMMMQEESVREIQNKFPYVSIIFGTHNVSNILNILDRYLSTNQMIIDVPSFSENIIENLPDYRRNNFQAFVNITYGCNNFCSYCVVPFTRGQERSRLEKDILRECQFLVNNGYKEITLLGQNVNSYGSDLNDGSSFAHLLEEVAKLKIPRLRFLTSYPSMFNDELIDVIAKYDNIVKYIHLPVQAGSNKILKEMNRHYTREFYLDLVKKLRKNIPNLHLSTDIIVGFPNETYEEFLETLSLVEEVNFSSAFTFIYSPRKHTYAATIQDNVEYEEKVRRFKMLKETLEKNIVAYTDKMIGKVYTVLVEGISERDETMLSGHTEDNVLVHFQGDSSLIGQIVNVKIITSHVYSMIGELVNG